MVIYIRYGLREALQENMYVVRFRQVLRQQKYNMRQ